jgi:predicted dienelactone hydrolase
MSWARNWRLGGWAAALIVAGALVACSSGGNDGPRTATPPAGTTVNAGGPTPAPSASASGTPSGDPTVDPVARETDPGTYAVGVTTLQLVDTSRPTEAHGDVPESNERVLPTEVWYPSIADPAKPDGRDARVNASGGPYPLIIFAHGITSSRLFSPDYTRHLASHGYVVAAPDFPLTKIGTPGGVVLRDLPNQAGDVSFVIDSMLEFNDTDGNMLSGAIDAEHIGLTGHSLGAFTTLITIYGLYGAERDDRIDAALSISGSACFYDRQDVGDVSLPTMFLTGSEDLIVPRAGNRKAYEQANAPRYFVELRGANHVRFSLADIDDAVVVGGVRNIIRGDDSVATPEASEGVDSCLGNADPLGAPPLSLDEQHEELRLYATPFFDAYLKDDDDAKAFLTDGLAALSRELASYEYDLAAGD